MTNTEVFEQVKKMIVTQLDVDAAKITMTTNFADDLALDSLDVFEVIDKIEDEYDIEIETDDALATVGDLVNYVVAQVSTPEE
ncbi:acyl carrier protein [Lactiplantibacillus mudanjiangensis]|uniref:Acyl carrier protein n=1 Tax=Lactiplantibacillus mudanjiangensis TaxID=1296538 RepID=A0A660E307_9LACO|nr:acyl carrier protein [Lactiplantibacillus mudanjiangensis]VDG20683.1 acyl carrier protein [Lactobacillus plantarum JDM1] [Lactiplantibacillus mudanjiangensis]VDG24172.1 acyl carrier protein [Lactobacillus plantarum JDM1] [Lactiplantibacillus mudanjiangensis]VDG30154.1 acyl carrier protein [Lactobacillus plantarum JDM1] [Lactiplantibacillus mudanjiangensis]VDG30638.1 acyl carrier protein [Lactobacillus plantarum JDM1] [Lactiplantibacillus mudanjiangensis]